MLGAKLELSLVRAAALPAAVVAGFTTPRSAATTACREVRQTGGVRIAASPAAVYALLDPRSPASRWALRGERIAEVGGRDHYRLTIPQLPDQSFRITLLHAVASSHISHECADWSGAPMGAALSSTSLYDIAPSESGSLVALTETTRFSAELGAFALNIHSFLMRMSMRADLLRLKYEAETGRDADARAS